MHALREHDYVSRKLRELDAASAAQARRLRQIEEWQALPHPERLGARFAGSLRAVLHRRRPDRTPLTGVPARSDAGAYPDTGPSRVHPA